MYRQIILKGFNNNNPYVRYFITFNENTYILVLRWNLYADCGFITISDYENNPIVNSRALVNGLNIRNNKLPFVLAFRHLNGETYEPTLDNISSEFAFIYNDEAVE